MTWGQTSGTTRHRNTAIAHSRQIERSSDDPSVVDSSRSLRADDHTPSLVAPREYPEHLIYDRAIDAIALAAS
jgi:hypothetical protein